jgi:hypothetical protein
MKVLTALPAPVREKIYLVHVARDQVPENSGLKIAPTGLSSTVTLCPSAGPFQAAMDILGAFLDLDLFRSLPPEKTLEFLSIAVPQTLSSGEVLFRKGDPGDRFFLIISGQMDIMEDGTRLTTLSRSDFFGEKCLFSDQPRTADAVAASRVSLVGIDRQYMQTFIHGTGLIHFSGSCHADHSGRTPGVQCSDPLSETSAVPDGGPGIPPQTPEHGPDPGKRKTGRVLLHSPRPCKSDADRP